MLMLEVADNGPGIAREALAKARAFGLKGLAERARTVGGWLDVGQRPGGGTAIVLAVPLGELAAAAATVVELPAAAAAAVVAPTTAQPDAYARRAVSP